MDNQELFQKVKDLKLPEGKYVLFGSAPMGIRGLKACSDADIIVSQDIWQEFLKKSGWKLKELDKDWTVLQNEDRSLEVGTGWGPGEWDCARIIAEAEVIDGLPFAKLDHVLQWKKRFGREKDLKDVLTIEEFLRGKR